MIVLQKNIISDRFFSGGRSAATMRAASDARAFRHSASSSSETEAARQMVFCLSELRHSGHGVYKTRCCRSINTILILLISKKITDQVCGPQSPVAAERLPQTASR